MISFGLLQLYCQVGLELFVNFPSKMGGFAFLISILV